MWKKDINGLYIKLMDHKLITSPRVLSRLFFFFLHVIIGAFKNILITPFKFIELHHQQLICDVETFKIITCAIYKYGIFYIYINKK